MSKMYRKATSLMRRTVAALTQSKSQNGDDMQSGRALSKNVSMKFIQSHALIALGLCLMTATVVETSAFGQPCDPVQLINPWTYSSNFSNVAFGWSLDVSGDLLVVGAPGDRIFTSTTGSAYVYQREPGGWTSTSLLIPFWTGTSTSSVNAGVSVSIDGDTAIVGANLLDDFPRNDQGATYVYRVGTTFSEEALLLAPTPAGGDQFGTSVAVSGDIALVGAPGDDITLSNQGAVYVFARTGTTWSHQTTLIPSDADNGHMFGSAIVYDGTTALISARQSGAVEGWVYVFTRSGSTWTEQTKLIAPNATTGDRFGFRLDMDANNAIIGAFSSDGPAGDQAGSAYIYQRVGTNFVFDTQLFSPSGAPGEGFGRGVAISGDDVAIGVYQDDVGSNLQQGSIHTFHRSMGTWQWQSQLLAPDGLAQDWFGQAVAIHASPEGPTFFGGAHLDDIGTNSNRGSVWIFPAVCPPVCDSIDFNNNESIYDPEDIDAFLSVYGEGPCIPEFAICNDIDFNNDSSLYDPCDIDSFLLVFSEGPCTPCGQ